MTYKESEYVAGMEVSSTLAVLMEAERLRSEGRDVIDFGAGEPDFPTPQNIKDAAKRALDENFTRYTPAAGIPALKAAIIEMMKRDFGVDFDPAEVVATVGGKQAIFNAMASVINAGDDVLIPSPYWVTFPEIARFLRARPVFIETESNDFLLTAERVRDALTPRTRLLIINSPNNPTGRIIPPAEFRKIIELAEEKDFLVISDECYLYFAYPPAQPYTAGQLPAELRDRVMVCGSFSKSHAMTGWRIGFALGRREWIQSMLKIVSHSTSNVNSITQKAAIEAATGPQEARAAMLEEYRRRRDWIVPALNDIEGVSCHLPEGAFYVLANVKGLLGRGVNNSSEFARFLLERAYIAVTPGLAFGAEGHIRISYANSLEAIRRGVERIADLSRSLRER
jgi:aspartate aminotransferase